MTNLNCLGTCIWIGTCHSRGKRVPQPGQIMNSVRPKDNKGERLGKDFLFLMAKSLPLSPRIPLSPASAPHPPLAGLSSPSWVPLVRAHALLSPHTPPSPGGTQWSGPWWLAGTNYIPGAEGGDNGLTLHPLTPDWQSLEGPVSLLCKHHIDMQTVLMCLSLSRPGEKF